MKESLLQLNSGHTPQIMLRIVGERGWVGWGGHYFAWSKLYHKTRQHCVSILPTVPSLLYKMIYLWLWVSLQNPPLSSHFTFSNIHVRITRTRGYRAKRGIPYYYVSTMLCLPTSGHSTSMVRVNPCKRSTREITTPVHAPVPIHYIWCINIYTLKQFESTAWLQPMTDLFIHSFPFSDNKKWHIIGQCGHIILAPKVLFKLPAWPLDSSYKSIVFRLFLISHHREFVYLFQSCIMPNVSFVVCGSVNGVRPCLIARKQLSLEFPPLMFPSHW